MRKPNNLRKGILTSLLVCVISVGAYAAATVTTSCGKKISTIEEKDSGMSEAEYDQMLRDLNEAYCGTRERPNID